MADQPSRTRVHLFPPNSTNPAVSPEVVPYPELLGKWHIIGSSHPQYKTSLKKNLMLHLSPAHGQPSSTFAQTWSYELTNASNPFKLVEEYSTQERVRGSGARWRAVHKTPLASLIAGVSKEWHLLGYHLHPDSATPLLKTSNVSAREFMADDHDSEWLVIYTPSTVLHRGGVSILARNEKLSEEVWQGLMDEIERVVGGKDGVGLQRTAI